MLDAETRRALAAAVRDSDGREVCGFLLVDVDAGPRFVRVANLGRSGGFLIPVAEERRVAAYAASRGGRIGAVVHSHASSLRPSDEDVHGMAVATLPWVIVCLDQDVLRARTYLHIGARGARTPARCDRPSDV